MQIYLMRHGDALNERQDGQRFLSLEGRAQIERNAVVLKMMHVTFDLIISSPKTRAMETAEIVAIALSYRLNEIEITDKLNPESSPEDFIGFLKGFIGRERILIVSHLPFVQNLASRFLCGGYDININFKTGSILRIDIDRLSARNGMLCYYLKPEIINIIVP